MLSTATTYNHFKIVIPVTVWLLAFPTWSRADLSVYRSSYGPQENTSQSPAQFTYKRKETTSLSRFTSRLEKDVVIGNDLQLDLNMAYGNLFNPSPDGYMGFSYFSAGIDSENRMSLRSTMGHYVDALDGDVLFSYRLIKDERNYTLENLGRVDDAIYENSFAASYKRYSDNFFLRETSLSYSLSSIPGDEFFAPGFCSQDCSGTSGSATPVGGYGDSLTHEVAAELAFGYEEVAQGFFKGLRTSLGFGYEYVIQEEFYDYSAQVDESVSLLASMQHKTPFGLINTSYKYLETSQTMSAGYSLRGVDFYLKQIRYDDGSDNRLLGFRLKLDLLDLRDPFKKISNLFKKSNRTGRGHELIRHNTSLSSNSMSTLPTLQHMADS